jgi:pimeloyl-ACP methyl ester carboxylesterase
MAKVASSTAIHIRDDQVIEIGEFGDPAGEPYFFFPGFLGSYYQASLLHEHAKDLGMRIIGLNKPGTGASTFREYATMKDYGKDIALLADTLEIRQYGTIGLSLGCSMALGAVAATPDRITRTCIAGALPPMDNLHFSGDLDAWRHETLRRCGEKKKTMTTYIHTVSIMTRLFPRLMMPLLLVYYSRMNREELKRPKIQRMLQRDIADVFLSRECVKGLAQEMHLASHWGFSLEEIRTPVLLMHGIDDDIAPLSAAKKMASALESCRCFFVAGDHYAIIRTAQTALEMLHNLDTIGSTRDLEQPQEPLEDRLLPLLSGLRTI